MGPIAWTMVAVVGFTAITQFVHYVVTRIRELERRDR